MNKCALFIPRPGDNYNMIFRGYVMALRAMGWRVYVEDPKTKLGCRSIIENYGVSFIFTHSRYGIRQLPIDVINKNCVTVFVDILPLNNNGLTIDGSYEMAHLDEPDVLDRIDSLVLHTKIEKHLWDSYFEVWMRDHHIIHVPAAADIINALPDTCCSIVDMAMIANFANKQGVMKYVIEPLCRRIELLGYSYAGFGDDIWARAGLSYQGNISLCGNNFANIYANAAVCPNVHTEQQVRLSAFINERSFMIPLCGGIQVSDNPLTGNYLSDSSEFASSITDYIGRVVKNIECQNNRFDRIRSGVKHVANNHTYFNRLCDLFDASAFDGLCREIKKFGNRKAFSHCAEMDARINLETQGVTNE